MRLAVHANQSLRSIVEFELGLPVGPCVTASIQEALEAAGIVLVGESGDEVGV